MEADTLARDPAAAPLPALPDAPLDALLDAPLAYCELHCHTPFTLRGAGSSIEALVARAVALGMPALAITDTMTLAGVVRFHTACQQAGIRPITGCELLIEHEDGTLGTLLALARDRRGYASLCGMLSRANLAERAQRDEPVVPLADLAAHCEGLIVLVGGCDGLVQRLCVSGRLTEAEAVLARYVALLGVEQLAMELCHMQLPESGLLLARLRALAADAGLRCVATNAVRAATREDYRVYDLMTCVRLGLTVDEPHPARPRNAERYLKPVAELRALFADDPTPLDQAARIAALCRVELLASHCVPPRVALPPEHSPESYLRALCQDGLATRFPRPDERAPAERQLAYELDVIHRLSLEEFFLCVHDIVHQAQVMGIRCAGRGSAANSLVAYLLGITAVDPLAHGLLFERFLNPERAGMPDIDIDVQSSRREELITYVESTYSEAHAAMVANVITYRLRLAVRDVAKALGFPMPVVNRLARCLPHFGRCNEIDRFAEDLARVVERASAEERAAVGSVPVWAERFPLLLELVPQLMRFPRHLSLHNGGLLLTRAPLTECMVVRRSANGVRAVKLDKDDVERLGMIKFDLLGLRTFDAIERCLDLIEGTDGARPLVDALPLDQPDPRAFELIRAGQTLAVFQIESPGQWHLLARTQPETFADLVIQTALFRPGPLQANMVHPYVARRLGRAPVTYAHPCLEPILSDTSGIVLFQEQVLEIAHHFAGLSYGEADGFRRAMSHYRTALEMEGMRERFVSGAAGQGIAAPLANQVFDEISCFVGYGFCKSHAAAFARTIYQTAWLKAHYPAHYLAGFLASQPAGFFAPSTVLEEAKLLGIPVLPVDVVASAARFSVERVPPEADHGEDDPASPLESGAYRYAIRIGLVQVKGVGEELALAIANERTAGGPYQSLADFCARLGRPERDAGLRREAVEALVAAGAFDRFGIPRRRLLWLLGEHWRDWLGMRRSTRIRARGRSRAVPVSDAATSSATSREHPGQAALPWEWPAERAIEAPRLPPLTLEDEVEWDLRAQGMSARPHALTFRRPELAALGARPIAQLGQLTDGLRVLIAGKVISAQQPPTAKGMAFLVLEDETGRVQVAVPPALAEELPRLLAASHLMLISGRLERERNHCSLLARRLAAIPAERPTTRSASMTASPENTARPAHRHDGRSDRSA